MPYNIFGNSYKSSLQADCIQNHIYRKEKTGHEIIFIGPKRTAYNIGRTKRTAYKS